MRSVARLLGVGRGEEGVLKALVLLALLLARRHRACPRWRTCARRPPTTPGGRGMADIRLSGYLELSARYPVYLTLPG